MRFLEFLLIKLERLIRSERPTQVLFFGYLSYVLIGFFLLILPFSQDSTVSVIDTLFVVVSAVSTTGLSTINWAESYNFFGEFVVLVLIQLGGIGYMTFGSFIILQTGHRISKVRETLTRAAFPLPKNLSVKTFLQSVVYFTFLVEGLGAVFLSYFFWKAGVANPIWSGIFHSISAFCTAGFSLYSDSIMSFSDNIGISLTLSAMSLLGAMGFIVVVDFWTSLRLREEKKSLLFTSKVILLITFLFLSVGTLMLYFFDENLTAMSQKERLLVSFFQTMSATTTVGFNSFEIKLLSPHIIFLLYFFMLFGASPSGTGGGLKSTTFSALLGLVRSTLKKREKISFMGRPIPLKRLRYATSAFVFCAFVLGTSIFILRFTEPYSLEEIAFEAISALGTVGLSLGLTSSLSLVGKLVIILLMIMGRLGVLSFGLALSTFEECELVEGDNELVM